MKEGGVILVDLLVVMLERVGIIIAVAFLLTRFQFFKNLVKHDKLEGKQEIAAILFFGAFGIIGTYFGVAINPETLHFKDVIIVLTSEEAIANSRVIGIVVAGLLGGYRLGIGAGLIAGVHRMFLGGFTAFSCGLSTIIAGVLAGALYKKGRPLHPLFVFIIGALAEAMQMGMILLLSKPFEKAFALVELIGVPMILANGVGAAIFIIVVHNVMSGQEKARASQAQVTLRIANQTLGHLRKGMTSDTAKEVCAILFSELKPSAVAMTDNKDILAHVGVGSDHHIVNQAIRTSETKDVIISGKLMVVKVGKLYCDYPGCRLGAAIIAPLTKRGVTVGTLKLYYPSEKDISDAIIELVRGLSDLLNTQLEIAETDHAYQLAKEAEIKALQAQISPHFLFNSLNIIMSLIRSNPDQARKLLFSLSYFLRQNVTHTEALLISLEEELAHVRAYLEIIEARFVDRLTVLYDLDETLLQTSIPPFTLQLIVENAIQHGIRDMEKDSVLKITIHQVDDRVEIGVEDNGKGMTAERIAEVGKRQVESENGTGMGLYNVNRRLKMTFNHASALHITSEKNAGTVVSFQVPKNREGAAFA